MDMDFIQNMPRKMQRLKEKNSIKMPKRKDKRTNERKPTTYQRTIKRDEFSSQRKYEHSTEN